MCGGTDEGQSDLAEKRAVLSQTDLSVLPGDVCSCG